MTQVNLYRRFVRARRGMSTIFGGMFFIILILMGFNMFLWAFVQNDMYTQSLVSMRQRDKQTTTEKLVGNSPGARDFASNSFNITINNLRASASIARIYIINLAPTSSNQCLPANPCIVDSGTATPGFVNGNVKEGEIDHRIKVNTGGSLAPINDGSGYNIVLVTTRGRTFSFFYPWPAIPTSSGGGGNFATNIGPLSIYFDFQSFNFTQGAQTQSQPAWCLPYNTNLVIWVKVANSATDSSVTLRKNSVVFPYPYSSTSQGGNNGPFYIVDTSTVNPNGVVAYDEVNNPYVLPPASANGPSAFLKIKFSADAVGGTNANRFPFVDFWFIFIGFSYKYRGQVQGQTIPFVAVLSTASYPGGC